MVIVKEVVKVVVAVAVIEKAACSFVKEKEVLDVAEISYYLIILHYFYCTEKRTISRSDIA